MSHDHDALQRVVQAQHASSFSNAADMHDDHYLPMGAGNMQLVIAKDQRISELRQALTSAMDELCILRQNTSSSSSLQPTLLPQVVNQYLSPAMGHLSGVFEIIDNNNYSHGMVGAFGLFAGKYQKYI